MPIAKQCVRSFITFVGSCKSFHWINYMNFDTVIHSFKKCVLLFNMADLPLCVFGLSRE